MFWFMNSKHEPQCLLTWANFLYLCSARLGYFHICNVALQTSNRNINLTSVDLSVVLMLLMSGICQSALAHQLSLVFTIYRGLMTHYQMSYPTWHLTQSVLNLLHYRSDLFLFQSYQASPQAPEWRDWWYFPEKKRYQHLPAASL